MYMKNIFLISTLLLLSSCWTDHFEMEYRMRDKELEELRENESFLSQYDYLLEKKAFILRDFYKPTFAKLSFDQRMDLYLKLKLDLNKDDISLMKDKKYYEGVSMDWIVVIFGPPTGRRQVVAGFERIAYGNKVFRFRDQVLVKIGD